MDNLVEIISDLVFQAKVIDVDDIDFKVAVRDACKSNMCGLYGKRWTCPPAVGTLEECEARCKQYKKALIFTTFDYIEDSFDFEGMLAVRAKHDIVQGKVIQRLDRVLKDKLVLGAGGCTRCKVCNYPNPCRFYDKPIASVESHGIDVVTLSDKTNLNYINGENTVTYFSIIFFNEE